MALTRAQKLAAITNQIGERAATIQRVLDLEHALEQELTREYARRQAMIASANTQVLAILLTER